MPLVSKKTIDAFYANKRIAVVGASRSKAKYGHALLEQLLRSGFDAVPVNPHAEEIAGRKCFKSVRDVSPACPWPSRWCPRSSRSASCPNVRRRA